MVQPNGSPCASSTRYEKDFDIINIHTLIRKLLHTEILGTIIKFFSNYIKGHKAHTTYIIHTSSQLQFKTGVAQGAVLSPTLFNIYTADLPPPRAPVRAMPYADDINITSTHTYTSAEKKYIDKVFAWTKHINITDSQHLSTRIQASANNKKHSPKQDGINRRRHSWLPTR